MATATLNNNLSALRTPTAESREGDSTTSRRRWILPAVASLVLASAACFLWWRLLPTANTTAYQAVLLANGNVYFGHLEGLGRQFPVLRDVYYVESGVDTQTRQNKSVLLKRGAEWHSPGYMILNASQIVLVEPVGKDSRVAALIAESKH